MLAASAVEIQLLTPCGTIQGLQVTQRKPPAITATTTPRMMSAFFLCLLVHADKQIPAGLVQPLLDSVTFSGPAAAGLLKHFEGPTVDLLIKGTPVMDNCDRAASRRSIERRVVPLRVVDGANTLIHLSRRPKGHVDKHNR
jgi:hypothetical protein